jgi:hypothetical protein
MGLAMSSLRFLVREHKRKPFTSPVLTLGRQCVFATLDQVRDMLSSEGIQPLPVDERFLYTNIPEWQEGPYANFTSDKAFFSALGGLEVLALDVSGYENADYLHDMNLPIPADLKEKFSLIIDGGTLEHIFDIKQALQNINLMLKPGGRIIHMSPTNNYVEHGYYQFSPSLFCNYYLINGFINYQCLIIEHTCSNIMQKYLCYLWDGKRPHAIMESTRQLATFFIAEKISNSTFNKIPQQGQFPSQVDSGRTGDAITTTLVLKRKVTDSMMQCMPANLFFFLKKIKRWLYRDLSVKPWGLKYREKL